MEDPKKADPKKADTDTLAPMFTLPAKLLLVAACLCAAAAMVSGLLSTGQPRTPRRKRFALVAFLCFGLTFCLGGVSMLVEQTLLGVLEAEGTIQSVSIHRSGKSRAYWMTLETSSGGDFALYATSRSPYFHSGQRARIRYRPRSGQIVHAQFLTASGGQEGVFHSLDLVSPYFLLLVGYGVAWMGWRYRNRPIAP